MNSNPDSPLPTQPASRPRQPVGPRLKILLYVVFGLFAILGVNAVYLLAIRWLEWQSGQTYQNYFYLLMFMGHLLLGLILVGPALLFIAVHIRNTYQRRNRRAVKAGFALFGATLVLLISGILLTRIEGVIEVNDATTRQIVLWLHILSPLFVIWLYVLHRLAGRRIQWRAGLTWAAVAGITAILLVIVQMQDPRAWNVEGPEQGVQYFYPSLARTSSGNFISSQVLNNDEYCLECHSDAHRSWASSAHHFSSFNNPAYLFSVKNTRHEMMQRHGSVQGARFCAGCHDPVPFFSGAFDDPKYDDPDFDLTSDADAQAGITCTVCHSISHINSPRGNSDYTIDEPIHYPFTFSKNAYLKWINGQLVKAKPEFHKRTFLKPLHKSAEFCGTCHKVNLPKELNDYRWLRGQNHYDSFWLSGVSGHSVSSFYYPQVAEQNCNECHMPQLAVDHSTERPNFAARVRDDNAGISTYSHLFPGANTGIPHMLKDTLPNAVEAIETHTAFLKTSARVDVFGLREEAKIDGELQLIDGSTPVTPGKSYLVEVVIRTLKMGHHFTQGTADSNEVWLDVTAEQLAADTDELIGRSGSVDSKTGEVDRWSYFVNAFVIDRNGDRINRRNAEDIFVALYNHQIPPGAATVVHYRLDVPEDATGQIRFKVAMNYRKFDSEYVKLIRESQGDESPYNDLPIVKMCEDEVRFTIHDDAKSTKDAIEPWQRWNDYGIGLLRSGQYRQAETAFQQVETMGNYNGALNLARVYLAEGRITKDAPEALNRALAQGAPKWSFLWFSGLVQKQLGEIDLAINSFQQIVDGGFADAKGRNFDFANDYRLLRELADTLYLKALRLRRESQKPQKVMLLEQSRELFERTLALDPENADAHYGIRRVFEQLGDTGLAEKHDALHARYKMDDNARDSAIAAARRKYPHANRAAERVVIYELNRDK